MYLLGVMGVLKVWGWVCRVYGWDGVISSFGFAAKRLLSVFLERLFSVPEGNFGP